MKRKFIAQNPRLNTRVCEIEDNSRSTEVVFRTATAHHDLRRAKVLDGCDSSTSLFDTAPGEVPEIFDIKKDRLDIADALLRRGSSLKDANKVATNTVTTESVDS